MFSWEDIRIFAAIVEEHSVSGAAHALGIHQSTVSRRLVALEEALGYALVRRTTSGVSLTPHGQKLLDMAKPMVRAGSEIRHHFRKIRDKPRGRVRVTTIEEIAVQMIVPQLAAFRKKCPEIEIELYSSKRILDLDRGEADISIRLIRPEKGNLHARKLAGFSYGVFTSKALAEQLPDQWQDNLSLLDWIVLEPDTATQEEWKWLRENVPNLKPVLRCNHFKTLVATVVAGLGVTILPKVSRFFYPNLVRLPLEIPMPRREIWLCAPRDRAQAPEVREVMDFIVASIRRPLDTAPKV